jgi:hypothetical protein
MFPVYGWKCLSQKAVHISEEHSKIADDARPGAEVAETTVKNFCGADFDVVVKQWEKSVSGGARYVEQ